MPTHVNSFNETRETLTWLNPPILAPPLMGRGRGRGRGRGGGREGGREGKRKEGERGRRSKQRREEGMGGIERGWVRGKG